MGLLDTVTKSAPSLPSRVYLFAQEKWGKSSFAAHAPNPIFIMTKGETGLLSLIESGGVPETAHFPNDAKTWEEFQDCLNAVLEERHDYKTLVIDTANGAERLLANYVLRHEFNGQKGGRNGYRSFGAGEKACEDYWTEFTDMLDRIRIKRKMSIILLAHSKIRSAANPEGDDYDQLRPEGIEKLWTLTHKWADIIAAGTYPVFVKEDKVLSKTQERVIRTSGSHAVVGGNRYSLPETIPCGSNAKTAFTNFAKALAAAKAKGKPQEGNGNGAHPATQTPAPAPSAVAAPAEASQEVPDQEPPEMASKDQRAEMTRLLSGLGRSFGAEETIAEINAVTGGNLRNIGELAHLDTDQAQALIDFLRPLLEEKQEKARKRKEKKDAKEATTNEQDAETTEEEAVA